jgi:UDP-3-O-[3-hydroxymyristoyl] glucosamine N-acyltransferase
MHFTALQIATLIQGTIEGNPEASVNHVAKIEEAQAGELSFIANPKYKNYIHTTQATIVIVSESMALKAPEGITLIRVKDAYESFAFLLEQYHDLFFAAARKKEIEQPSCIAASAQLGEDVYVGAFAYIGKNARIGNRAQIYPGAYIGDNVVVGEDSVIYAGVKIYQNCEIGNRVIVHAGTVIGSDGFGFAPQKNGRLKKVPQIGNVVLEDDVEIGANTTLDRATMGSTRVRKGVKLDNLIQIAHNADIGENTVIAAQTGVSGSTKIGQGCIIGGQVGMVGHIQIADYTSINAQSGISKSITEQHTALNGSPAFDYKSSLKSQALFRNLPNLHRRILQLEETVQALTTRLNEQSKD